MIHNSQKGFTIIEILVYTAITSIIVGSLTLSLLNNLSAYHKSQATHNTLTNINSAMYTIMNEVRYAKSVYIPTSTFASSTGQLSLETALNVSGGEKITYVDFYLDNGRVYEKREGVSSSPLTSERVVIGSLQFMLFTSTSSKNSVSIGIQGRTNTVATSSPRGTFASTTITSTAALRGAY